MIRLFKVTVQTSLRPEMCFSIKQMKVMLIREGLTKVTA